MNSDINIAICESESQQLEIYESYLHEWANLNQETIKIKTFLTAESFLFNVDYSGQYDLIFLDTKLRKMSGMELAKKIRETDLEIEIVFITREMSYVFEGYNVNALNYLLEPIKKEEIFHCLNQYREKHPTKKANFILVQHGTSLLKLNLHQIIYIRASDHYIDIKTEEKTFTIREKIVNIEQKLPKNQFFRCHRSYIVNLSKIEQISKGKIQLKDKTFIPITKTREKELSDAFTSFVQS